MALTLLELTEPQKRLWFEWKLNPESIAYNTTIAYKLQGDINYSTLNAAVNILNEQHASLRTFFKEIDEIPKQCILETLHCSIEYVELLSAKNDKISAYDKSIQMLYAYLNKPFALDTHPLHRYMLIKLNHNEYIFGLTWHHIIIDAPSVRMLIKELAFIYNSLLSDQLPEQYYCNDHLIKHVTARTKKTSCHTTQTIAYWKNKLANARLAVTFPKKSIPDNAPFSGERIHIILSKRHSQVIFNAAKHNKTTLFIYLAAALNVVLFNYTQQDDICVGYSVSDRTLETKNDIGFFVNTLILRNQLHPDMTFLELIKAINQQRKADKQHQNIPTLDILAQLRRSKTKHSMDTFNIILNQSLAISDTLALDHCSCDYIYLTSIDPQVDFMLRFDKSSCLEFDFEYNTHNYEAIVFKQMINSLIKWLIYVSSDPHTKIYPFYSVTARMRKRQINRWNHTTVPLDTVNVLRLFEHQALSNDSNIALMDENEHLTYSALNYQINQLSHYLLSQGVRKNDIVAVMLDRSLSYVITVFAILKIGAAYLPLDRQLPSERMHFIIKDAHPRCLITHTQHIHQCNFTCPVLCLDEVTNDIAQCDINNPDIVINAHDLAYVIYTSGSTGQPKGVMIEHNSLSNRIQWMQSVFSLQTSDKILHKTPCVFDVSVWELLWPLAYGAQLIITPPGQHKDIDSLIHLIDSFGITLLHFIPSMLSFFLESHLNGCHTLKYVICSGEALQVKDRDNFYKKLPHVKLYNLYGPTEATIDVTYWDCQQHINTTVPIGKPIWNTEIYIMDNMQELLPVGVTGEIVIGGTGLARGYLNRLAITKKAFIPHPFKHGERLYRSGDLGRYLINGAIEYLGRMDDQIKINGIRVELGEIETMIKHYQGVNHAVILTTKNNATQSTQLIGYLLVEKNISVTKEELISGLKSYVSTQLPDYMRPSNYIILDQFPLLVSGKVDKARLAKTPQRLTEELYIAPRSELEKTLVDLWQNLLKIDHVGIGDDFFLLGGHSLLAIQLITAIRKTFNITIRLDTFLKNPTIANVVTLIAASILQR